MRIGLIGYGEVGRIFAQALRERSVAWVGTYDILLKDAAPASAMRAHAERAGVAHATRWRRFSTVATW